MLIKGISLCDWIVILWNTGIKTIRGKIKALYTERKFYENRYIDTSLCEKFWSLHAGICFDTDGKKYLSGGKS